NLGAWSRVHRRRFRPSRVRIGRTDRLKQNRSKSAESSLPVSGLGHSFEAATHSFRGTGRATPSPASKTRSFRIFRSVLRIAEDALKISSQNVKSASGSLPVVTRRYRSSLSPERLTGPTTSSGTLNFVRRIENFVPPVQESRLSRSSDLAQPGGPTSRTCS